MKVFFDGICCEPKVVQNKWNEKFSFVLFLILLLDYASEYKDSPAT